MTDEVEVVDDPTHGPAEVTTKGLYFDERNSRTILETWYDMMSSNAAESVADGGREAGDCGCGGNEP
jgi:hypothetical protein